MLWTPLVGLVAATSVSGTVELNGCRFQPARIELRAFPLVAALGGERTAAHQERPGTRPVSPRRAALTRTGDPHLFEFRIDGLDPEAAYRLRIGVAPDVCGRVFWRGPVGGLVAGGQRGVRIEGFTATSQLEVFDAHGRVWVGRDHLGFSDPATGTRSFRWRSTAPGQLAGELQIATAPFPIGAHACAEPAEGVLLRRTVARSAGRWVRTPPIDFNGLLLPVRGRTEAPNGGPRTRPVTAALVERLSQGAPLYVRVVPRTIRGLVCDTKRQGVSGSVVMAQLPGGPIVAEEPPPAPPAIEAGNDHKYAPPFLDFYNDGAIHPNYKDEAYLVIRPHTVPSMAFCQAFYGKDAFGCTLLYGGIAPGTFLEPGSRFSYFQTTSGGGGGFLETFTGSLAAVVTGAISAAGLAVDFLSQLYEDIKAAAAKVVKSVIEAVPGLGQLCSAHPAQCEDAIEAGIDAGLAAMGMPPSLPNWDDLKQQGVDYLAAEIASQTGVPQEVVDQALEVAQEALEQMTANRGLLPQPGYNWLVPYYGVTPASLVVEVTRNDPAVPPVPLYLLRFTTAPFAGETRRLPFVAGHTGPLRVPTVLHPNLAGIRPPLCSSLVGTPLTCEPGFIGQQTAICLKVPFNGPLIKIPCPDKTIAVYYRDAWIPRLASGCTALQNLTLTPVYEEVLVQTPFGVLEKLQLKWRAVPGFSVGVFGLVHPPVPFQWSGVFGAACTP